MVNYVHELMTTVIISHE